MSLRILFQGLFATDSALDVRVKHLAFLGQSVGQDDHISAMEEVEDPVVHTPLPSSKFVDPVTQEIDLRPAQLTPELGEAVDTSSTLGIGTTISFPKIPKPFENWSVLSLISKKSYSRRWHPSPPIYQY